MTTAEIQLVEKKKILRGLKLAYKRLLAYKKANNRELVILKDNKIVKIKP